MGWLNYHHLYYFQRVARAGSLAAAARELHLSHSTLSVQIRELGESLGGALFEKRGRRLVLTPKGEEVLGYADDIVRLGTELLETAERPKHRPSSQPVRVGVVPGLPRSLAYRLIERALATHDGPLILHTSGYADLIGDLAASRLHVVLADAPPESGAGRGKVFAHTLGRSGIALYAAPKLARELRGAFPRALAAAPFVLPARGSSLRRLVDRWLSTNDLRPRVIAEVGDAAMMRTIGARGLGVFPVRLALSAEVEDWLGAERIGNLDGVVESYFAVSYERRVKHPFVSALVDNARNALEVVS